MNDAAAIAKSEAQADKMLSEKQGYVGTITFNNPARHNAVSREMWETTARMLEEYAVDPDGARRGAHRRRRQGIRLRRRHLQIRERARHPRKGSPATTPPASGCTR